MAKRQKATEKEVLQYKLGRISKDYKQKIDHLYDQNAAINRKLSKLFSIWDGFFKVAGFTVAIVCMALMTWLIRGWYYTNGKWNFSVVVLVVVGWIAALFGIGVVIWKAVEELLMEK